MSAPDDLWRAPVEPRGNDFFVPPREPVAAPPEAASALEVKGEVVTGVAVLAVCALVGAPLGLIWATLRPKLDPLVVSAASESALKPQFTADLKLALIGLAAGAVAGTLAWLLVKRHGTGTAIGLALGGYAAMRVAAEVGKLAAHPDQLRAVTERALGPGETLSGTPQQINDFLNLLSFHLRSDSVLYTFSLAALLLFGALSYAKDRLSWDSAATGSVPAPAQPSAW